MSQPRPNLPPTNTSSPERMKRSAGTSVKSPHKSSTLSPVKKSAKQSGNNGSQTHLSPDFHIPSDLTDQNNDLSIVGKLASFSPLSLTDHNPTADEPNERPEPSTVDECPEPYSVDPLNLLAELPVVNPRGVPSGHSAPVHGLPLSVSHALNKTYSRYVLLPETTVSVPSTYMVPSANPERVSEEERLALEGRDGLFHSLCPVWKTLREKFSTCPEEFEYVYSCFCKCKGCPYKLIICRFQGGLVALQKCENVNGVKVPTKHNYDAHFSFTENGSKGGVCSLSHAQKEYVVQHYKPSRNNNVFVKDLSANRSHVR